MPSEVNSMVVSQHSILYDIWSNTEGTATLLLSSFQGWLGELLELLALSNWVVFCLRFVCTNGSGKSSIVCIRPRVSLSVLWYLWSKGCSCAAAAWPGWWGLGDRTSPHCPHCSLLVLVGICHYHYHYPWELEAKGENWSLGPGCWIYCQGIPLALNVQLDHRKHMSQWTNWLRHLFTK